MNFANGKTLRIRSNYYANYALNVYGTNAASTGRNVCLYDDTPSDIMQRWILKTCGSGYRLCSAVNSNFVLDCSDGSLSNSYENNAHLCASSYTSETDSKVIFITVSSGVYKIYLPGKNLYLTATNIARVNGLPASSIKTATALVGGSGGQSNVYWAAEATSNVGIQKQCWIIEDYSSGGSTDTGAPISPPDSIENVDIMQRYNAPLSFTGGTITIKNVQSDSDNVESYHYGSGFRPSENNKNLADTEKGEEILSTVKNFVKEVYLYEALKNPEDNAELIDKVNTAISDKKKYAYYLFGEYDSDAKFHHGVDLNIKDNGNIYAFWGGEVVSTGGNYGKVQIYVPELDVTTIYLHMKDIPNDISVGKTISAGTLIGHQSNVSKYTILSHLHFEVRAGRKTAASDNTVSSETKALTSVIPYGYMKK